MVNRPEPVRSLYPYNDLRCPVGSTGAHVALIVVIGFLTAVTLGFGKADTGPPHTTHIMVEVGEPSPIVLQHATPIAGPTANAGCRP